MARPLRVVALAATRATVAAHLAPTVPASLRDITLAPHQRAAARHVARLLRSRGGALLADDVGLGKTFVALAVARGYTSTVVIAPAALCPMWKRESARAGICIALSSYEALSRGTVPEARPDLLILDEAHHARSPKARRYAHLATLAAGAHTLLLSATPIPNRLAELRALFALFLGESADAMPDDDLQGLIVRRTAATLPDAVLPALLQPRWIEVAPDADCLDALERLPPPVPPAGGGDGGALLRLGLVRQWASSRAALRGALRRRLARACALEDSLRAGRLPTSTELSTWQCDGDALQLGFAEMLAAPLAPGADAGELMRAVTKHRAAVAAITGTLAASPDPDADRAGRLLDLRGAHPEERILCFTSFAETADAYWRHLRAEPSVARLTASGGMIASGPIDRDELLARFAPRGQGRASARSIEQVTLLIATDILAEGLDLRDATVVVHLDLPWSPARLAQRVGRARRLGSDVSTIAVYAMRPPAPTEAVLGVEARLREKAALASRTVGGASDVMLPRSHGGPIVSPASDAERMSRLLDLVSGWDVTSAPSAASPGEGDSREVVASAVHAPVCGWLAVIDTSGRRRLVARIGAAIGDDVRTLERAVHLACGGDEVPTAVARAVAAKAVAEAMELAGELAAEAELGAPTRQASIRREVLCRIDRIYAAAGASRRVAVAALAARARGVAARRLTAGLERRLRDLCDQPLDDDAWLRAVGELAACRAAPTTGEVTVCALIAFVRQ